VTKPFPRAYNCPTWARTPPVQSDFRGQLRYLRAAARAHRRKRVILEAKLTAGAPRLSPSNHAEIEMWVKVVLLAALLASIIQPIESRAQAIDGNQMQAFIESDVYQGLLTRALAGLPQSVFPRCPTLVSGAAKVTVLKPMSFAGDGSPNAGFWRQRIAVKGCGNDTVLNIFFSAAADEKINTVIGIPGGTLADLTLQRDAAVFANTGAMSVAQSCKSFEVTNTRFEGFGLSKPPAPDPGSGNRFRPWWETWTMIGCGRTIDVPIDFIPDEKGTQIRQPGGSVER
jgi:hypothetical protein